MSTSKWMIFGALVCAIGVAPACAPENTVDKAAEEIREAGEKVADETKNVAQKVEDKTKEIAEKTADKTKEIAGEIADKSKEVVSATGEAITDGWITTKLSAKFVDEKLLKDS